MRTIATNEEVFFRCPNHLLFTNSPYSYVKITAMNDADYIGRPFTLVVKSQADEFEPVRMTRIAKVGTVWPIGQVLEALAAGLGTSVVKNIVLEVERHDFSALVTYAIVGAERNEVELLDVRGPQMLPNTPAPQMIVIYTGFDIQQTLYLPLGYNGEVQQFEVELGGGAILATQYDGPFVQFASDSASNEQQDSTSLTAHALINSREYSLTQRVRIDPCTEGVLLKWLDKHSIPCFYRWSVESVKDEAEVEETTVSLDENLQPIEHSDRMLTHTYTLHSRLIEQQLYDLCVSILGNRGVWMYDTTTEEWRPCVLGESDAVDDGAILKDLVIEVQTKEYIR